MHPPPPVPPPVPPASHRTTINRQRRPSSEQLHTSPAGSTTRTSDCCYWKLFICKCNSQLDVTGINENNKWTGKMCNINEGKLFIESRRRRLSMPWDDRNINWDSCVVMMCAVGPLHSHFLLGALPCLAWMQNDIKRSISGGAEYSSSCSRVNCCQQGWWQCWWEGRRQAW